MVFHRWSFIDKGLVENFQGLYERSMRKEPPCKEVWFIGGSCGSMWFLPSSSLLLWFPANREATGMSYHIPVVRLRRLELGS